VRPGGLGRSTEIHSPHFHRIAYRPPSFLTSNLALDLGEVGRGGVDWIGMAHDREQWRALLNAAMNLRVALNIWKFSSGLTTGLSSSAQLHVFS
jgi:hypothetical protein